MCHDADKEQDQLEDEDRNDGEPEALAASLGKEVFRYDKPVTVEPSRCQAD